MCNLGLCSCSTGFCFVLLFCFVLFCFILFCAVLFFVLFLFVCLFVCLLICCLLLVGNRGSKMRFSEGAKIQKIAKMADFDHFFLFLTRGQVGEGAEPPTGGECPPIPPPPWCRHCIHYVHFIAFNNYCSSRCRRWGKICHSAISNILRIESSPELLHIVYTSFCTPRPTSLYVKRLGRSN